MRAGESGMNQSASFAVISLISEEDASVLAKTPHVSQMIGRTSRDLDR